MVRGSRSIAASVLGVALLATAPGEAQQAPNVAGGWTAQWGAGQISIMMQQQGALVVGTYSSVRGIQPGAFAARFRGNVLVGRWTDADSSGGLSLVFSADGRSFVGTWGRTIASVNNGGPWTGQRN